LAYKDGRDWARTMGIMRTSVVIHK
jgi:hypothetical protein